MSPTYPAIGGTMPVERMRMRPWLEEQINSNTIPGLKWLNKEKKIFQIPWMHAARHGWDVEKDAPLFRNWAIHTGKHQPGVDKPDPKTWKANFRCAMNSLPDIEEVKDRSIKKGNNAFRVYRMLPLSERPSKKGKKPKTEKEERVKHIKVIFGCLESSCCDRVAMNPVLSHQDLGRGFGFGLSPSAIVFCVPFVFPSLPVPTHRHKSTDALPSPVSQGKIRR